jgi:regulatory protein
MARRESRRAGRSRGEDPGDARAPDAGAAEVVAARAVLDAKAARLAAGDLLARRAWTRAELTRRLRRRGAPDDVAAAVVADVVERGYVDDAAYARHWVTTRVARGYGAARLRAELRARGVATGLIDAALGAGEGDAAFDRARDVAQRRLRTLGRARPDRLPARLRDYLLRRGYSAAIVARVVRELAGALAD